MTSRKSPNRDLSRADHVRKRGVPFHTLARVKTGTLMDSRVTMLLIAIVLSILAAFLFRYELVGLPPGGEATLGTAYRLDRWTGELRWIHGPESGSVVYEKP